MKQQEDARLVRRTSIWPALPEVERAVNGQHAAFPVRAKTFACVFVDHHGDGMVALGCKAGPGRNAARIATDPERFSMPACIRPRGWVGLRLDTGDIDWQEVAELLTESYRMTAPRRLAEKMAARA